MQSLYQVVRSAFLIILLLVVNNATCLALPAKSPRKVTSIKSNGLSETFYLPQLAAPDDSEQSVVDVTQNDTEKLLNGHMTASPLERITASVRSTFLPRSYPDSIPAGYLSYCIWNWIQDLSTQLRGVLATQRILEGVGVGREGATALSAFLMFLVRDGCGMVANLLFTSFASSSFSADVKRWRLFADVMVDLGLSLEVAATLVPKSFFLPMISMGNMCKAVCGVAAGAVGGVFNLYWARGSDIADIQAKFGAQNTITGALGIILAGIFAKSVADFSGHRLWFLYISLMMLHIYANTRCMKLIAFDSLNKARMNLLLKEFFQLWTEGDQGPLPLTEPREMARQEPLWFLPVKQQPYRSIRFGHSFNEVVSGKTQDEILRIVKESRHDNYVVASVGKEVVVSVSRDATKLDKTRAYLHAALLTQAVVSGHTMPEMTAKAQLKNMWPVWQGSCQESGWDLRRTELPSKGYEYVIE